MNEKNNKPTSVLYAHTIDPADVDLLRNAGVSEADIDHSVNVAEKP